MNKKTKTKPEKVMDQIKSDKRKATAYVVLRVLVVMTMISQFFNQNYENVFTCILTLVLFFIPDIIDKKFNIELPNTLEVIMLLFIFSAQILGEIQEYYLIFPMWDTILHTMNGFLMAAIGFSLVDILNRSESVNVKLSPLYMAFVAFCFSMTVGVLWEFFEYGMDTFFGLDMQKDTVINSITSVMFNPDGKNVPVTIPIETVHINGELWNYGGYIDIGLIDTMIDMFVNFIGAVVFSIIGYFYVKNRGKGNFAEKFIPTVKSKESEE